MPNLNSARNRFLGSIFSVFSYFAITTVRKLNVPKDLIMTSRIFPYKSKAVFDSNLRFLIIGDKELRLAGV